MSFLKSFSVYGLTNIFGKGLTFLLAIVLTHKLSPEDFGIYALFTLVLAFAFPLVHLGVTSSNEVEFYKLEKEELGSYLVSSLVNPFFVFLGMTAMIFLLREPLTVFTGVPRKWLLVIPFISFLKIIPATTAALFRAMKRPWKHALLNSLLSLTLFVLTLAFIVYYGMNWQGRAYAIMFSQGLFFLMCIATLYVGGALRFSIKKKYKTNALKFGLPLVPFIVGAIVVDISDRLFIASLVNIEQVGIYNIGYKVGAMVGLLQTAFLNAWHPFLYERLTANTVKDKAKVVKYIYLFALSSLLFSLMLKILAPLVFNHIVAIQYQAGVDFVFWVALGYMFLSLYNLLSGFILYAKKKYTA